MSTSADVVRRFYQAVASRDLVRAGECFTPDAVWHLPGDSAISGDHVGWPAIRDDFLAKLGPLSGGTFQARLLDVAVGEEYVVAVQHAVAQHAGRHLDVTGCQLIRLRDGLIHEVRGHYSDEASLSSFWQPP
jgi:ketosteroid isomerase-like protein